MFRNRRQILKDVQQFNGSGDSIVNSPAGILLTPISRQAKDLINLTMEDSRFANLTARSEDNLCAKVKLEEEFNV